jgi:hypothetical protein
VGMEEKRRKHLKGDVFNNLWLTAVWRGDLEESFWVPCLILLSGKFSMALFLF